MVRLLSSNAAEDTVSDSRSDWDGDHAQAGAVSSGAGADIPGALSAAVSGVGSAVPPKEVADVPSPLSKGVGVPRSVDAALESVEA